VNNYNLKGIDVIVIEKHAFMRRLLTDVLKTLGVSRIRETSDPEIAYELFKEKTADLVLTDWAPGLDGLQLLQKLRDADTSPDPFVPVIVVSANTEPHHIFLARDAGMMEFLAKPITAKRVYSRICSVIEKRHMFIRSDSFFGPDRRRRRKREHEGTERRRSGNKNGPERRMDQNPFYGKERRADG